MVLTDVQKAAVKLLGYEEGITNGGENAIFTSPKFEGVARWALIKYIENNWVITPHAKSYDMTKVLEILNGRSD
jgi:hypothetical protein